MSSNLIKKVNIPDKEVNSEAFALKEKLNILGFILALFGLALYILQIISPLTTWFEIILLVIGICVILWLSINVGKYMFLIQDDLILEAYDFAEGINEDKDQLTNKTEDDEYKF